MSTLAIFLVVLSILVLVHEFGHFAAALFLGIKVEEFALGLPFTKPLVTIRRGEILYSVYPLLFGGFVRLHGEEADVQAEKHRSFWNRGKKQRMAVILAGVAMNLVLALVGFAVLYSLVGIPVQTQTKVTISAVVAASPAQIAGLVAKDRIIAVEGKPISSGQEFSRLMKSWAGLPVRLTVQSGQTVPLFEGISEKKLVERDLVLVPRPSPPAGEGPLGIAVVDYPYINTVQCSVLSPRCWFGISNASVQATSKWIGRVAQGLRGIGKSLLAAKAPEGVSGPIGIYHLTGIIANEGPLPLLEFVAVLSVNLAVFNVLPIPALDGGRMAIVWLEWLRRKRVSAELEQKINSWGMAFLLGLILLISLQDVLNLQLVKKLFGK